MSFGTSQNPALSNYISTADSRETGTVSLAASNDANLIRSSPMIQNEVYENKVSSWLIQVSERSNPCHKQGIV